MQATKLDEIELWEIVAMLELKLKTFFCRGCVDLGRISYARDRYLDGYSGSCCDDCFERHCQANDVVIYFRDEE